MTRARDNADGTNVHLHGDTTPQLTGALDAQTHHISNAGAIGVGTTAPTNAAMDVIGTTMVRGTANGRTLQLKEDGYGFLIEADTNATDITLSSAYSAGKISVKTAGSERMRLMPSGRMEFQTPTATTGTLAEQRLDWRNENNAGVMASIGVHREAGYQAPSALVFRTSANVDSAANSGDGEISEKMRISSQGYITAPNVPAFTVNGVTGTTTSPGSSQVLNFGGVYYNNGNHFNITTDRFVAPVSGYYFFAYSAMVTAASHTSNIVIRKNGSGRHSSYTGNTSYLRHNIAVIEYLAANDYVDIVLEHGGIHAGFDHFSGFLIG